MNLKWYPLFLRPESLNCRRDVAPHTPAPALCGNPSGLVDLGACAPAQ